MSRPLARGLAGVAILSAALVAGSGAAEAKGCLKGAVVGGLAGHVAGKHGLIGAAAGCAVGRYRANRADRRDAEAARGGYR